MILFPRKTKYKNHHKGKDKFNSKNYTYILPKNSFFGLKVMKFTRLKSNQIESARRVIIRRIKRKFSSSLHILSFTDRISSKKSSGVRMGKGKGNFNFWYTNLGSGKILFELKKNIPYSTAKKSLLSASKKFPIKCKFVSINL